MFYIFCMSMSISLMLFVFLFCYCLVYRPVRSSDGKFIWYFLVCQMDLKLFNELYHVRRSFRKAKFFYLDNRTQVKFGFHFLHQIGILKYKPWPNVWVIFGRKSKILEFQKNKFVCILKCHFDAKNGLQWVNLTRVLLFRSKFSDP